MGLRKPDEHAKKTHHADHLWVYSLCDYTTLGGDIFEHLMQSLCLDLLSFELRACVIEIKQDTTLVQLFNEEL